MVDLESVSLFPKETMRTILDNDVEYKKTPFLFLMASYVRNEAMDWASEYFKYIDKRQKGSWMIYCFEYI